MVSTGVLVIVLIGLIAAVYFIFIKGRTEGAKGFLDFQLPGSVASLFPGSLESYQLNANRGAVVYGY